MHIKAAFSLFLGVLIIAFFLACSDDNNNPTYPFEKTVLDVNIAKRCLDCYVMLWRHPIEKKDLESYYIWLDTTVVNDSVQNVSQAQMNAASKVIPYSGIGDGDSLVLTDLISGIPNERDSLHIAIWAKYTSGEKGAVNHFYAHFGDDMPPSIPAFSDSSTASVIWIDWLRPTDQRDFYLPDDINGPIAGYNVGIQAINTTENIRNNATITIYLDGNNVTTSNLHKNFRFEKKGREVVMGNVTNTNQYYLGLAITDGKGFVNDNLSANSWRMLISGLQPERSYNISISAWDSAGNSSYTEKRVATTDQIAPLIASKFWYYKDEEGKARLDSNRLILFWPNSVDPLNYSTQIRLDSVLSIPSNCLPNSCYREVESYSIEQKNGNVWEAINRISPIQDNYYNVRYKLGENDSMVAYSGTDINGTFVSDTLRWILPRDTVILRIRAIDSSKHYSSALESTIYVSKGELGENNCPLNFVPVKSESSVFCMEKLQHYSNNNFVRNVLYIEAIKKCEEQGYSLCTEIEWNAACNSGGNTYGVIEERDFSPAEFLSRNCGVGTGDSLSAYILGNRKKICASPDGIRDLPGQLQEWVTGINDSGSSVPILKGSSYVSFTGASIVELSLCRNRFTPTRVRPRYTTDSVYLYRTGSRVDTLFERNLTRDSLGALYAVLSPSDTNSFKDFIYIYSLKSYALDSIIGTDYVDQKEYNRRGGEEWLKVLWQGLEYKPKDTLRVLILGTESIEASNIFLDPTVGFRCCTAPL